MNESQDIEFVKKEEIKHLVEEVRSLLDELENYIFNEKRCFYVSVKEYVSKIKATLETIFELAEVAIEDDEYIATAEASLNELSNGVRTAIEGYKANKKVNIDENAIVTVEDSQVLDDNTAMLDALKVDRVETTLPTQDVFIEDIAKVANEIDVSIDGDMTAPVVEIPEEVIEVPVQTQTTNYLDAANIQDAISFDTTVIPVVKKEDYENTATVTVEEDYSTAIDTAGMNDLIASESPVAPAIKF